MYTRHGRQHGPEYNRNIQIISSARLRCTLWMYTTKIYINFFLALSCETLTFSHITYDNESVAIFYILKDRILNLYTISHNKQPMAVPILGIGSFIKTCSHQMQVPPYLNLTLYSPFLLWYLPLKPEVPYPVKLSSKEPQTRWILLFSIFTLQYISSTFGQNGQKCLNFSHD